jgi:sulfur relay (sulfurtransferase) complex TusBCD TusD component (DsrE family)
MAQYVLIESRDPFESADVAYFYDLARALAGAGHDVSLFLVQNGVLPVRPGPRSAPLTKLAEAHVTVLADAFSLRERGIAATSLTPGVRSASLDVVIDGLAQGARALWH